jgi:hypothetical protein
MVRLGYQLGKPLGPQYTAEDTFTKPPCPGPWNRGQGLGPEFKGESIIKYIEKKEVPRIVGEGGAVGSSDGFIEGSESRVFVASLSSPKAYWLGRARSLIECLERWRLDYFDFFDSSFSGWTYLPSTFPFGHIQSLKQKGGLGQGLLDRMGKQKNE